MNHSTPQNGLRQLRQFFHHPTGRITFHLQAPCVSHLLPPPPVLQLKVGRWWQGSNIWSPPITPQAQAYKWGLGELGNCWWHGPSSGRRHRLPPPALRLQWQEGHVPLVQCHSQNPREGHFHLPAVVLFLLLKTRRAAGRTRQCWPVTPSPLHRQAGMGSIVWPGYIQNPQQVPPPAHTLVVVYIIWWCVPS